MCPALAASALLSGAAWADRPTIYSCVDGNGKRLTSDRPIVECQTREQRVLNADGSVKRVVPPTLTADEVAEQEARDRRMATERAAQQDAVRRDRNLRLRFPNEAAHNRARAAALDDLRKSIVISEKRLAALEAERKPLLDEAEFYIGRTLPRRLKQAMDAIDATSDAQRSLIANQQNEMVRINALYDVELERLRRLWAGMPSTADAVPR